MNGLEKRIKLITNEIKQKIIPENIKEGINILGVNGTLNFTAMAPEYNECLAKLESLIGLTAMKIEVPVEPITISWADLSNRQPIAFIDVTFSVGDDSPNFPALVAVKPATVEDLQAVNKILSGLLTPEEEEAIMMPLFFTRVQDIPFSLSPDAAPVAVEGAANGVVHTKWALVYNLFGEEHDRSYVGKVEIPLFGVNSFGDTDQTTITLELT